MAERDPHELSEALQKQTDEMARESREVGDEIEATREEWERKRADQNVPGAPPPDRDETAEPGPADDD